MFFLSNKKYFLCTYIPILYIIDDQYTYQKKKLLIKKNSKGC